VTSRTTTALTGPVVALFNASDDTVEMVQRMLDQSGIQCLVYCRFADLRKGVVDYGAFLQEKDPQVVIIDISPPYEQNWAFFRTLRDAPEMQGRGLVLTTTNKDRLDEVVGQDSTAMEIVGKPYDLQQITTAIDAALLRAAGKHGRRRSVASDQACG
jgi:DNA-binding response OmpR family regulator